MISLIIPTLNEEKYLPLLLSSIKKQDFGDYEIIVADAGSKDKTIEIASKYGCRIVKGGLLPFGRNRGADAAKGDTLLFLDADVILPESFLRKSVREFKERGLGIAGFDINPINPKAIDSFFFWFFRAWAKITEKFSPHSVAAIMSQKKVHDAIGGFDEKIIFIEDYSYTKEAAKISKFGHIKEPFFTSLRRYEKDGRWPTYIRYALGELHILFIGPIKTDIFKYQFAHYDKGKDSSK